MLRVEVVQLHLQLLQEQKVVQLQLVKVEALLAKAVVRAKVVRAKVVARVDLVQRPKAATKPVQLPLKRVHRERLVPPKLAVAAVLPHLNLTDQVRAAEQVKQVLLVAHQVVEVQAKEVPVQAKEVPVQAKEVPVQRVEWEQWEQCQQ